jgi:hypothetical protein
VQLEFYDLLSTEGLNSLTFSDTYAKLSFTTMVTTSALSEKQKQKNQKKVLYIDTDTTFTSYLLAGFVLRGSKDEDYIKNKITSKAGYTISGNNRNNNDNNEKDILNKDDYLNTRLINVYLPSEGRFESILEKAIILMPEASIVIFDSLNSFYNMYPKKLRIESEGEQRQEEAIKVDHKLSAVLGAAGGERIRTGHEITRLNHLLSIFVMLLVKHGVNLNVPVLVTSMIRYKRRAKYDLWVKSPVCRRLIHQKSVVRLGVEMSSEGDLYVNIMKHPTLPQQKIVFHNRGIIRF